MFQCVRKIFSGEKSPSDEAYSVHFLVLQPGKSGGPTLSPRKVIQVGASHQLHLSTVLDEQERRVLELGLYRDGEFLHLIPMSSDAEKKSKVLEFVTAEPEVDDSKVPPSPIKIKLDRTFINDHMVDQQVPKGTILTWEYADLKDKSSNDVSVGDITGGLSAEKSKDELEDSSRETPAVVAQQGAGSAEDLVYWALDEIKDQGDHTLTPNSVLPSPTLVKYSNPVIPNMNQKEAVKFLVAVLQNMKQPVTLYFVSEDEGVSRLSITIEKDQKD